jgi:hypothetical protein
MRWLCILLLVPLDVIAQRDFLSAVSFRPPFSTFDSEGKRLIPNFETGGHVDLNENFIRLTPDRAVRPYRCTLYYRVLQLRKLRLSRVALARTVLRTRGLDCYALCSTVFGCLAEQERLDLV